jgi:hypothetical protein
MTAVGYAEFIKINFDLSFKVTVTVTFKLIRKLSDPNKPSVSMGILLLYGVKMQSYDKVRKL